MTQRAPRHRGPSLVVALCVAVIRAYQGILRPHLIGSCKFCPTCSEYAIEALTTLGFRRGAWIATKRLIRCHPFSRGGLDPVFLAAASRSNNHAP
jgi:putative membrane protein insertion efficiency factor